MSGSINVALLPEGEGATLRSALDVVAVVLHAAMVAAHFQLSGIADTDSATTEKLDSGNRLPVSWRLGSEELRTLEYTSQQGNVLIKVLRMARHTLALVSKFEVRHGPHCTLTPGEEAV